MFDWDKKTEQAFWVIVGYVSEELSIEITPSPVSIIGKCASFVGTQIKDEISEPTIVPIEVICGLLMLAEKKNESEKNILINKSCDDLRKLLTVNERFPVVRRVPAKSKPIEPIES